jgi:hypothetical protein
MANGTSVSEVTVDPSNGTLLETQFALPATTTSPGVRFVLGLLPRVDLRRAREELANRSSLLCGPIWSPRES